MKSRDSTKQPGIAPLNPDPAEHLVHTLVACWEETGGGMSHCPGHNGEVQCVLPSG